MSLKGIQFYLAHPNQVYGFFASRRLLDWLPDIPYVKLAYRMKMGKRLDLENPKSFNEKLLWLKVYDHNPFYSKLVDKYEVKEVVAESISADLVIPNYGVWNTFDEIDFNSLPEKFVLKCTHDSGGLVICRDKSTFDVGKAKNIIEKSLKNNFYYQGREWPYKNVRPRIIAEKYMTNYINNIEVGLIDYKFFVFNHTIRMLYVSQGLENHSTAKISFFDMEGNLMPFHRKDFKPFDTKLELPSNFEEMIEVTKKLDKIVGSDFVRIDLYSVDNKTYFSEITFSPCSGMIPFEPEEWDLKIGDWLTLTKNHR